MPEENNIEEAPKAEGASTETQETKSGDGGSLVSRLKNKRSKRVSAKKAARLDLLCLILILIFASYFKASKYAGQNTPLLYYYKDAYVVDTGVVEREDEKKRYCVVIQYDVGTEEKRKYLYFKKDPTLIRGDVIKLKIQTLNPDNIEIEDI